MVKILFAFLAITLLSACSLAPGIYLKDEQFDKIQGAEEEPQVVPLLPITPTLIREQYQHQRLLNINKAQPALDEGYQYLVGPQDVLHIVVWEHPELTIPAGAQRPIEHDGSRVHNDGTIFYPYIGIVHVEGKSTEQIRVELTDKLSKYIKKPQLDVRVVAFNSQKARVVGSVNSPGSVAITDISLTLSDAINQAGGVSEKADIQEIVLSRNGVKRVLNLQDFYSKGDGSQDILLKDKDIVFVPANSLRKVYVMGEVANPGSVSMPDGQLSLSEVITGISQSSADPTQIFVLRNTDGKAVAYHLDASGPAALILATTFALKPLDVVFVSTTDLTRWNRTISQLMPTVETLWTVDRLTDLIK